MNYARNERGGSLLIVLLILVIFTLLGLSALAMNLTATKQLNKKGNMAQSRHLAEMGILHYKADIDNAVLRFNSVPANYMIYTAKGVVDQDKSFTKYKEGLCKIVSTIDVSSNVANINTGSYSFTKEPINCKVDKIEQPFISHGQSKNGNKNIKATIIVAQSVNLDGGNGTPPVLPGIPPQKPNSPAANAPRVNDLDDIRKDNGYKVVHGTTSKDPFTTSAAIELLGSVDMNKKSTWIFGDNLLIGGSFSMKTAGNNLSTLTVNNDFYIGGSFHTDNHNSIIVSGNFIVMGNSNYGTKSSLQVNGNALFGSIVEVVDTHATITIEKDAYFQNPVRNIKNNANFCVKGRLFLWKNNKWVPYLPTDIGYSDFNQNCIGSSQGGSGNLFEWGVLPEVNPDYSGG